MQDKIQAALQEGYSPAEVLDFLSSQQDFGAKVSEARAAGYGNEEILSFLNGAVPASAAETPAEAPGLFDRAIGWAKSFQDEANENLATSGAPEQTSAADTTRAVLDFQKRERETAIQAEMAPTQSEVPLADDVFFSPQQSERPGLIDRAVAERSIRDRAIEEGRSVGEVVRDLVGAVGAGLQQIPSSVVGLFAPDSETARDMQRSAQVAEGNMSPFMQARLDEARERIQAAAKAGLWEEVKTASSEYLADPALFSYFALRTLPSMVGVLGPAKLAMAAAAMRGAGAAQIAAIGANVAGGANAVMTGGDARQQGYDTIYQALREQGVDEETAKARALDESLLSAGVGAGLGWLGGKYGAEAGMLGLSQARTAMGRGAASFAGEVATELPEELAPQLMTNSLASRIDGRNPLEGLGETAVQTIAGVGPMATAGGISAARTLSIEEQFARDVENVDPAYAGARMDFEREMQRQALRQQADSAQSAISSAATIDDAVAAFDAATSSTSADLNAGTLETERVAAQRQAQDALAADPLDAELLALEQEAAALDLPEIAAGIEVQQRPTGTLEVRGERVKELLKAVVPDAPVSIRADGSALVSARFAGPVLEVMAAARASPTIDQVRRMSGLPEQQTVAVEQPTQTPTAHELSAPIPIAESAQPIPTQTPADAGVSVSAPAQPTLSASGNPFKTERAAAASAKQRKLDMAPVAVDGGWGLAPRQPDIPADTITPNPAPAQAKGADKPSRLKPDPVLAQRAMPVVDDLRAMSQDAGWAEQGGRLLRDADGKASRTKWIPRAEWFLSGMEGRPDVLAQHLEDMIAGRGVPVKSRRTIEGMLEWLDAQRGGATLDEDASMYDFERSFDAVLDNPDAREAAEFFDDGFGGFTEQSEADAMRALGFTEEEIANAGGQTEASAGSVETTHARGTAATGERAGETGAAQTQAGREGSREGLTLDSYTNEDIAQREAGQPVDDTKAQADRERDATPFALDMQSQAKPQGVQGGMFTVDGGVSEEAALSEPTYAYATAGKIDSPTQGVLANAKQRKDEAFARLKVTREQVKNGTANHLDLLKAEDAHKAAVRDVESAQEQLEHDANRQGLTTNKGAGQGGLKFSRADRAVLDSAERRIGKFVDAYLAGQLREGDSQLLGDTPVALQAIGNPNLQLEIDYATINKVLSGKHSLDITADMLKSLPKGLYDPLAIFVQPNGGVLMLTNLTAETGNPVVAAIHFRVQSNRMRVNRIASVYEYSRAGDRFTEQATNLRYIKSRKALESSTTAATPNWAEVVQKAQERGNTVLTESDVVKLYGPRYSFAGQSARTADTMALDTAQRRIEAGEDAETVRQETGWFRGVGDGKWRFEINDAPAPANAPARFTRESLVQSIASRLPSLTRAVESALRRGDEGKAGGVVVVERAEELAGTFASKTGRTMDDAVQLLGSDENGQPQGFYDPKSKMVFMVGSALTAETAPAVLLHEATHAKQRADIDARALALIDSRDKAVKPVRDFLDTVAARMEAAGEAGNASEASAYIVEEAVLAGRKAGFSAVDGKLMSWIDRKLGKRVGDLVRDFVAMIRAWGLRAGVTLNPSIDELVALAKLNVRDMGRGNVTGANADGRMASMSDRNRVASEQAPNPAGDGMTGGATPLVTTQHPALGMRVPVRVISSPGVSGMQFSIENGESILRINPVFATDKQYVRTQMSNGYALSDFLWPFGEDVFIRTSDNSEDYKHLKNGTHRGSKNHVTNETEGGLSVSRDPAHAAGKYAYLVRGNVTGQGSDGEPLLDTSTAEVASKRMTFSEVDQMIDAAIKERARAMGLSDEQLRALRTATDLDFSRMNEPSAPDGSGVRQSRASQTASEAFKKWFGASKVVDENGAPMAVYHGTTADISAFDPARIGATTDDGDFGAGFYFTTDQKVASSYAGEQPGSNVVPVLLSLQNPLVVESMTEIDVPGFWEAREAGDNQRAAQAIQAAGYDGVIETGGAYPQYVAFHPEQIKSATGNNGNFDPSDRRLNFSRAGGSRNAPGAVFSSPTFPDGPIKKALEQKRYEYQDRFIDLKKIQASIEASGRVIRDEFNPYMAETLMYGKAAYRVQTFLEREIEPVLALMRRAQINIADLDKYLHARHAEERNAAMAARNPSQAELDQLIQDAADAVMDAEQAVQADPMDGKAQARLIRAQDKLAAMQAAKPWSGTEEERQRLSGMSNDEAQQILDRAHAGMKATAYRKLGEAIDKITGQTRAEMAGYGLESGETVAAMDSAYQHYVPLKRDMEESELLDSMGGTGRGFSIRGSQVKQATGSLREVENIFANIVAAREATIVRGEKNRVAKALYGLVMEHPNPELFTVIRPGMSEKKLRTELQSMGLDPDTTEAMIKAPTQATIDEKTGLAVRRVNANYARLENAVVLRVNGEDRVILFNKESDTAVRLVRALRNDDNERGLIFGFMKRFGPITRYLSAINTQYNPVFGLTNFTRDIQGAMLNLQTTAIKGKELEILGLFNPAMNASQNSTLFGKLNPLSRMPPLAGIWNWERGDKSHPWAKIYEEFLADGGATGYRDQYANLEDRAKAIVRELNQTGLRNAKGIKQTLDLLSDYNTTIENAIRLAAYKVARDAGVSRARAADLAKDVTVNFNRKGARSGAMASFYAFFNAGVQSVERTFRVLNSPAGRKIIAGGTALGVMQAVLGILMLGDDWDEIPEFERAKHLIIPLPGTGEDVPSGLFVGEVKRTGMKYIKIPLPLTFHAIPNVGRTLVEMAYFRDRLGERTLNMVATTVDAINVLGSNNPAAMISPSFFDPVLEIYNNENYAGRPIERRDFSSLAPTPGWTRAKESTSSVFKAISYGANWITSGGNPYEVGLVSPTPEMLSYMTGVVTGGLGREIDKVASFAEGAIKGDSMPAYKIPIVSRFYGEAGGDAVLRSKYYDAIKEINAADFAKKRITKDGGDPSKYEGVASLAAEMRSLQNQISDRNKDRQAATDKRERKELEAEILSLQQQLVDAYEGVLDGR